MGSTMCLSALEWHTKLGLTHGRAPSFRVVDRGNREAPGVSPLARKGPPKAVPEGRRGPSRLSARLSSRQLPERAIAGSPGKPGENDETPGLVPRGVSLTSGADFSVYRYVWLRLQDSNLRPGG